MGFELLRGAIARVETRVRMLVELEMCLQWKVCARSLPLLLWMPSEEPALLWALVNESLVLVLSGERRSLCQWIKIAEDRWFATEQVSFGECWSLVNESSLDMNTEKIGASLPLGEASHFLPGITHGLVSFQPPEKNWENKKFSKRLFAHMKSRGSRAELLPLWMVVFSASVVWMCCTAQFKGTS